MARLTSPVRRLAAGALSQGAQRQVADIKPPAAWPGLGLAELWRMRSICTVLVRRNLMVRYRQTVVGAAWTIPQPIALMAVFTIFFGLFARMPSGDLPYPVFFFLGLWPFYMASKILSEGSTSVVNNSALVTRVYIPRVYFPLSVALASLVDLAFGTVALVILLALFGIVPGAAVVLERGRLVYSGDTDSAAKFYTHEVLGQARPAGPAGA